MCLRACHVCQPSPDLRWSHKAVIRLQCHDQFDLAVGLHHHSHGRHPRCVLLVLYARILLVPPGTQVFTLWLSVLTLDTAGHLHVCVSSAVMRHVLLGAMQSRCNIGAIILPMFSTQSVCMRSKDWRCRARLTPARSPWRAHVACALRLRQRQSFERTLLSQKLKSVV